MKQRERNLSNYIGLKKGVLTVVEILKPTNNNKNSTVKCLCSKCGQYSIVRLDRLTIQAPYAEHYCVHCRNTYFLNKAKEKYIGLEKGVLKCIDVVQSLSETVEGKYRTMAICTCSRCGAITTVRTERLSKSNKYVPQACNNCEGSLYGQRTKERYQKIYGCEGDEYENKHHDSERIQKFISGAKQRNLSYSLSEEEAIKLLHGECYYCGQSHADGIDRVDSLKGYSIDNCVPCCSICNIMKNKFDTQTFFDHIKLIYNKHFKQ